MNNSKHILKEYIPSEELVRLVQENLGSFLLKEYTSVSELHHEIRNLIASSVVNYLATIGRGLCRGDKKSFYLTLNGELTETVLKGLFFRIPVGLTSVSIFSKVLCKDLFSIAPHGLLDTQFAKTSVINGELVLTSEEVKHAFSNSSWNKATVFEPK